MREPAEGRRCPQDCLAAGSEGQDDELSQGFAALSAEIQRFKRDLTVRFAMMLTVGVVIRIALDWLL